MLCFTQLKAFDSGLEMVIFMNSITSCDDFCQPNDMHAHQHVWFEVQKISKYKTIFSSLEFDHEMLMCGLWKIVMTSTTFTQV